jgi:predicted ABC-type sugar transport system permease subunit
MIREALESAYKRSIGMLKDWFLGFVSSITRGGGLVPALYVLLVVALMAGFVNAVVFPVPNQTYIPYPNGNAQTIPEAIVDAFVIATGGAGIYLTYLSGRQTVRARTVNLYLGLALLLLVVSLFTGIDMAILKGLG